MAERDEKGRFVKGSTGNPKGRMPKTREIKFFDLTVSAVSEQDWVDIVDKAKKQAKYGDAVARKWIADYLVGQAVSRMDNERMAIGQETIEQKAVIRAEQIAAVYDGVYRDILDHLHNEYVFAGGRGSGKSSFIALMIVYLVEHNPDWHAIVMRRYSNTLRDSVYAQVAWAISEISDPNLYRMTTSPMEITYIPTGQKIFFKGLDAPEKLKSLRPPFGQLVISWIEECDQVSSEDMRKVDQTLARGADKAYFFRSYNPPRSKQNFMNKYWLQPKATQYKHASNYLDLPKHWLGEVFYSEAEHLRSVNDTAWRNEYMGEVVGDGGNVFDNVQIRAITDEEIKAFDRVLIGLDFGFYPDPAAVNWMHFDRNHRVLYLFDEINIKKKTNHELAELIKQKGVKPNELIIADSAEPKSIREMLGCDLMIRGAEKGRDSVLHGFRFLQGLKAIVVDPARTPNTLDELINYQFPQDKDGSYLTVFPDKNDHHISAIRYALALVIRERWVRV